MKIKINSKLRTGWEAEKGKVLHRTTAEQLYKNVCSAQNKDMATRRMVRDLYDEINLSGERRKRETNKKNH